MAKTTTTKDKPDTKLRPALTPEAKEGQLVSLAIDLVEKRLREGTASSQETTHFLKLGTTQARLEIERAKLENELIKAKTEAMQSQKRMEEVYTEALKAMQRYSGHAEEVEEDEDVY